MKVKLDRFVGFPLALDPDHLEIHTGPDRLFTHKSRCVGEMKEVLYSPDKADSDQVVYHLFYPERLPANEQAILDQYGLTYSFVLMEPIKIGDEFAKTQGHYHPVIPGTHYGYPEIYTQLYGELLLLLQARDLKNPDRVADFAYVKMTPGFTITVPPGYAHVLVNTSKAPALMAGLYGKGFAPEYADMKERRGLAYYVLSEDGGMAFKSNPRYDAVPAPRSIQELHGTPFEYRDAGKPVWQAFLQDPEAYAFLTSPDSACAYFGDSSAASPAKQI